MMASAFGAIFANLQPCPYRRPVKSNVDSILMYQASPKHCEPITAERPGTKCPDWSAAIAQELLATSELIGSKRFVTRHGVAFVGQMTAATDIGEIWHGYPEAWDRIPAALKSKWKDAGVVTRRQLKKLATRAAVVSAFGGKL